jgi:hypothetical protein
MIDRSIGCKIRRYICIRSAYQLRAKICNITTKRFTGDYRKEELRKRDYFFHPQLNTNPMMERDLSSGNRKKVLIEGVFFG